MLPLLLSATLWCCPSLSPAAPARATTAEHPGDEKALRALEAWLKLYRDGKIDFRDKKNARNPVSEEYGLSPKNSLGRLTWAGDLDLILDAIAKLDSEDAAIALLSVAAIGIDQGKYTVEMAPFDVRAAGEVRVLRLSSAPAKEQITKAARGELKVDKGKAAAFQAAGVRCIGLQRDPASRPLLEAALADNDEIVRVSAAEALGALGDDAAALSLIAAVERDTVDAVLVAAVQALRTLYARHLPKAGASAPAPADPGKSDAGKPEPATQPGAGGGTAEPPKPAPAVASAPVPAELPESVRLAVRAAIKALGRGTWRSDMAMVNLLSDFRSQEAMPALITVLERFQNPEELKSGKMSGLLLYQAHELLVAMTGAVFPANQPDKWRAFWEAEKDKIVVTQKREPASSGETVASGFCGIPVQGTRIVFVLDLSGSMDWPMDEVGADGKKKRSVRIDFAKRELHRAMDAISPNASFNLVTFNGDDKAESWEKDLVIASEKNRTRFKKYVDGLKALGGTNLWSGLEDALKIKSLVYGNRYATAADEIFVLSDGAPTVGDVQDPIEMLRLVQECNKFAQARINTFFISSATPPDQPTPKMSITPQELMRRMAEQNGGRFREL